MRKILSFFIILSCLLTLSLQAVTTEQLQKYADELNDSELTDVLMKYGRSGPSYPPLNRAMEQGDFFAVVMLIEYGVDINSRHNQYYEIINGSGSNAYFHEGESETILEKALKFNDMDLLEYFLIKGADPTLFRNYHSGFTSHATTVKFFKTAVGEAIEKGNLEAIILFSNYGVDLNKPCNSKTTPIQLATMKGMKDIINFLISVGVDI